MRWEDEPFIKLYTRPSAEFLSLSWKARGLFDELMKNVDRAGVLECGKLGIKAISVAVRAPWVEIEAYVRELLDDGCVVFDETHGVVLLPNFLAAQSAIQSDAARKRKSRELARAMVQSNTEVTNRDGNVSRVVTGESRISEPGHAASRDVTLDQIRRDQTPSSESPGSLPSRDPDPRDPPAVLPAESGTQIRATAPVSQLAQPAAGPGPAKSPLLSSAAAARDAWEAFVAGVDNVAWGKGQSWSQEARIGAAIVARVVADGGNGAALVTMATALGRRWVAFCDGRPQDPIKIAGWLGVGAPERRTMQGPPPRHVAQPKGPTANWTPGGRTNDDERQQGNQEGEHGDRLRGAGGK